MFTQISQKSPSPSVEVKGVIPSISHLVGLRVCQVGVFSAPWPPVRHGGGRPSPARGEDSAQQCTLHDVIRSPPSLHPHSAPDLEGRACLFQEVCHEKLSWAFSSGEAVGHPRHLDPLIPSYSSLTPKNQLKQVQVLFQARVAYHFSTNNTEPGPASKTP